MINICGEMEENDIDYWPKSAKLSAQPDVNR